NFFAKKILEQMEPSDFLNNFGSRLVTLCDGRSGLRSGLHMDVREPKPADISPSPGGEGRGAGGTAVQGAAGEAGTAVPGRAGAGGTAVLDFISSDETLDRYGEIIAAN